MTAADRTRKAPARPTPPRPKPPAGKADGTRKRKAAGPKKRAARKPTRNAPHKPGNLPAVLRGFDRRQLRPEYQATDEPPDPWTEHVPARRILIARRAGATHTLAAQFAKVHPSRIAAWNARGREVAGDEEDLAILEATGLNDEDLAMAAFYVLDAQAESYAAVAALNGIVRASRDEWRAGVALLRVLPSTKREYSEVQKLEHTGPDGDAIPIEARADGIAAALEAFVRGKAGAPQPETEDGTDDD